MLKSDHASVTKGLHVLKSMPEEAAAEVVRQLRSAANPTDILQSLAGQSPSYDVPVPFNNVGVRSFLPTQSMIELEFASQHANAYPLLFSMSDDPLELKTLQDQDTSTQSKNTSQYALSSMKV